jgi:3-hydroxyisobutyrate dehydrogenase-like beta-hydroxyacid dehydrogenase
MATITRGQRRSGAETLAAPTTSTVGMVGLGIMGSAMAANLMATGFRVIGYDLVERRRRDHRRAGGLVARSARDVGTRSPIVISSLPAPQALLTVAQELAAATPRPRIVIETSTLPIAIKAEARRVLRARGITLLDCPLSGTGAQARAKDLVVYASGERAACRRVARVLEGFSRAHYYVGPFGAGSKTKFVANLLVAIHNVAAAEALVLAEKAGLDPALTLKVIADGAGASRMLQVRGPMMVRRDYSNATMKLDVWQKDMTVIAEFAREIGCPTPLFAATAPFYVSALAMRPAHEDTGAVHAVLEAMANTEKLKRGRSGKVEK